jgi:hypothetical protein
MPMGKNPDRDVDVLWILVDVPVVRVITGIEHRKRSAAI